MDGHKVLTPSDISGGRFAAARVAGVARTRGAFEDTRGAFEDTRGTSEARETRGTREPALSAGRPEARKTYGTNDVARDAHPGGPCRHDAAASRLLANDRNLRRPFRAKLFHDRGQLRSIFVRNCPRSWFVSRMHSMTFGH